jgi:hypothetical protein
MRASGEGGEMIDTRIDLEVDETPEVVFDKLADVRNERHWNSVSKSVEKTSEGPIGEGTTFRAEYGQGIGTLDMRIVEYDRPTRIVFEGSSPTATMAYTGLFAPSGNGTRLESRMQVEPRGWTKVLTPLMRVMFPRNVRKQYDSFKEWVERERGAASA